mmetsp:Transcript_18142/g.46819  ORF Transcript_18142/g.46819 Transcript_18142/m.46819 type:complete len:86 (-) Transcript_18142:36-293(-)
MPWPRAATCAAAMGEEQRLAAEGQPQDAEEQLKAAGHQWKELEAQQRDFLKERLAAEHQRMALEGQQRPLLDQQREAAETQLRAL